MNAVIKGAKGGSKSQRQPKIANDTTASKTYARLQYGMSEGEVEGLANGFKSIFLDDTPVESDSGARNFQDVTLDFRSGTNDQTYMEGFESIASEAAVGVELKSDTPWVKGITNLNLDAVIVRVRFGALKKQDPSNGDVSGIVIDYSIEVQTDGGAWELMLDTKMSGKTSPNYERTHRIGLPKANNNWLIRVTRKTPNSSSEYVSDKMYIQAITEVIDLKLTYPNTAVIGVQYDAETFSNIAKIAVDLKGVKIKVPSNYDPVSRTYIGIWDGTFKRAYTNNPAWIYYDLCTNKRYALGNRLTEQMIDKWSLYRLAQYCDQLVPDGKGGQEPRFTCNVYIQSAESAFDILSKLAGVFRAISYWDGTSIVCDADLPQDTYFTYTRANVIDGHFEYSGTRARDRHNAVKVAWDNPQNRYKTEYVFVRDEAAIAKLGVRIAEIDAWGCTSEGQAQRAGLWALKSEQLETRTVSFKVGLDGYIPQPGKVIEIADELFAGRANGGRISAVSADRKVITLDRDDVVCRAGDRLVVNGEDGKAQTRIVSSKIGRKVTVTVAFDSVAAENVWVVDAQDLKTMKFRVMSITQDDKHQFSITGLQYESAKYNAIDFGAFIDERPISIINPTIQAPVTNVLISSENMVQQGLSVETMVITWDQAQGATKYQVEWRKDDGNWIKLPITGSNSVEVQGIYAGNYEARVTAISAFDIASLPTYSVLTTLSGKQGLPPALANIAATGILFGYRLNWNFPATGALDTAYTEIEIASTANGANAAQLGLFAYPTNSHVIQGMQPNLTRYFRGRLIDRIGNVGPWSQYASATTSADASAVLDILSGKLSESQLSQGLIEKIENSDLESNQAFIDVQQKIEGLNAQYYLRIQSGKYVSGFGLGVDGGRSDFIVHSDSFALGNPAGGDEGVSYPFTFRTTLYTDPDTGTVFPVGAYMKSAFMDYQSVKTSHIEDLAVKSAQIDDLAVTSGKIANLAVDTLKIKDEAVSVPVGAMFPDLTLNTATLRAAIATPIPTNSEGQLQVWENAIDELGSISINRNGGKASISATLTVINLSTVNIALAVLQGGGTLSEAERRYVRMALSVYRNGTLVGRSYLAPTSLLGNSGVDVSGTLSVVSVVENGFQGSATYTMKVGIAYMGNRNDVIVAVGGDTSIKIVGRCLSVIELKK